MKALFPKTDMNIEKMAKFLEDQFVELSEINEKSEALKMYVRLCKLIIKAKIKLPSHTASIDLMKVEQRETGPVYQSFCKIYVPGLGL